MPENHLQFREILTEAELFLVGQLRYRVTVDEMGLSMKFACHGTRTVIEPLDKTSHIFGAWCGDELVGTARISLLEETSFGYYQDAYGLQKLIDRHGHNKISITTRLVVDPRYRKSRVSVSLPVHVYRFALSRGIVFDLIDSRRPLVRYFARLGYLPHDHIWKHPEFGDVVVQCLSVTDEKQLAAVGSPFLAHLREHQLSRKLVASVTNPDISAQFV